jgi:hypothetical protein
VALDLGVDQRVIDEPVTAARPRRIFTAFPLADPRFWRSGQSAWNTAIGTQCNRNRPNRNDVCLKWAAPRGCAADGEVFSLTDPPKFG